MDCFEIGMRFPSYKLLMETMEEYCQQTQSKFWKRDARTITASRSSGIQKFLNPNIVYYEIKFTCIYGGLDFKSKGRNIRIRNPSLKTNGCPAYLRFKASEDGDALQLVAINLNHNHELILPTKKSVKRKETEGRETPKRNKRIQLLKEMDNVEIEQQEHFSENNDDEEEEEDDVEGLLENTSDVPHLIEVQYEESKDIKTDLEESQCTGLIAPVFTPFNDDEQRTLNLDIIPEYAQYLVDAEITGVLINGTTGEGTLMTTKERKMVTEVWTQICSQTHQHLMVQVGGASLPDVIDLAQHAEQKGANSILCLPELYHKPQTVDDLIRYLQIVGRAAPNTPLFYYHIPSFTNVNINMGMLFNQVGDKIPTFKGIKFTSTLLDEGVAAVKAQDRKFTVFLGADTIMAGAYTLGFDSAIATTLNIFPEHGQRILQCIKEGNITDAQSIQDELNAAIEAITKNGTWVPTMKVAMNLLSPLNLGPTREPLKPLTKDNVLEMKNELVKLGFIQ
ncbi:hypothetical protein ILUMI_07384 [Ignelater luminosus]|uniref:N-acetylneuraminate lyase n=1 Tax=Ignelater luminosus TaxID=2038154 RepID=A0A8K0D3K2_IGNLU|nr:hypothetical protein ILUMI_07384 [Ignelater luminosus]